MNDFLGSIFGCNLIVLGIAMVVVTLRLKFSSVKLGPQSFWLTGLTPSSWIENSLAWQLRQKGMMRLKINKVLNVRTISDISLY